MEMEKFNPYLKLYWFLILLRIILVFIPQTGFIHPDEFFQSMEVLAGKFFNVECSPPWEFNSTLAIRSMAIPYFTVGMSYKFLKGFNNIAHQYFGKILLTPYSMLITPRFLMCIFSFFVDFSLYRICHNNNEKYKSRLVVLSSSYVMLVYATRTFSNTIELILFSVLLFFVCESLTFSNILIRKKEYINYRLQQSKTIVERAKFHKLRLFMVSDSFRNGFIISTVTVLGFFNRPTFLAFAIIPIFFWLYRGIGTKSVTILQFHSRLLIFVVCSIPTFVCIILIDSFYYGYLTWGEIGMFDISINNFVFTPLNFIKYNLNPENLAKHGLHPWFLHVLVNIPLLFNVLGFCSMFSLLRCISMCFSRKFHLLPSVRSIKCLMTLSLITPVVLLSLFQHQEPRFLLPVIIPLVYLYGPTILLEVDDVVIEASKVQLVQPKTKKISSASLRVWFVINTFLTIFYGFVHQGGVYRATEYISQDLTVTPLTTEFHIVTSYMYSIPESFLLQRPSKQLYKKGKSQYSISRRVFLYEEGSKDISLILKKLQIIVQANHNKFKSNERRFKVLLLISSSLEERLNYWIGKQFLNFSLVDSFYPHLSMEAFPDFTSYCLDITSNFYEQNCTVLSYRQYFSKVFRSVGLNLYEVASNNI